MLQSVARALRHAPGLDRLEPVWSAIRPLYQKALDPYGEGAKVRINRHVTVRMPRDLVSAGEWSSYEREEVARVSDWLRKHPGAVFVDVGCAKGFYSLIGLSLGARVIAIDADAQSLVCTQRFCQHEGRPEVIWGFATDKGDGATRPAAKLDTMLELSRHPKDIWDGQYTMLEGGGGQARHALDDILPTGAPTLIKADIEGAELLMLRGAERFLREERPTIALSVHPYHLPIHGHSPAMVRDYLTGLDYDVDHYCTDHEEHWWCSPKR